MCATCKCYNTLLVCTAPGQDLVAEASIVSHLESIRTAVVGLNGHAVDFLRDRSQQARLDEGMLPTVWRELTCV